MAVLKITYSSAAAITCTLTSLADAASRESSVIPNTSDLFDDVIVRVKTKGQAGGTDRVYVWVYAAVGDTIYTDGATGSDAAFTTANILNCVGLGSIRMNGANDVVAIFTGIADLFGVGVESFSGGYTDNVTQFNPDGDTYQTVAAWVVLGRNAVAARIFGQNAQPSGNHFCTLRPVEQSEFTFSATTGSILVSQLAGGCQYGGPPLGVPVFIAARVDASNCNNRKGWTGFLNAPPLEWISTGGDVGSGVFKAVAALETWYIL